MTDVERALAGLDVEWPATPDLARGDDADRGRAAHPRGGCAGR